VGALQRIRTLAANTLLEAIRSKILFTLLFFALVMIASGLLVGTLSYADGDRIVQDVGLASIRLFGTAIAIFLGVGLIFKEVERRTIYTILSKPTSRTEFLLGKYCGLVITVWLQVVLMAAAFGVISLISGAPFGFDYVAVIGLIMLELALVVALATLFSAFSTPMLSSMFTLGIVMVGHLSRDLLEIGSQSDVPSMQVMTKFIYRLAPDLGAFDLTLQVTHGLEISQAQIVYPLVYGVGYLLLLLMLASLIFSRRDFN
jgi:ABC-type transport system involved in multi-copper enzyme maturation permease subunit